MAVNTRGYTPAPATGPYIWLAVWAWFSLGRRPPSGRDILEVDDDGTPRRMSWTEIWLSVEREWFYPKTNQPQRPTDGDANDASSKDPP